MSRTLEDIDATFDDRELIERAHAIVSAMCHGDRRWHMTIPLQASDSDVVIGNVIRRFAALRAEVERLREDIARLESAAEITAHA
jgi:hypothetical protein